MKGDALSWPALTPAAQRVMAALALLPGLAWTADDLAALVAPQDALPPELLVAGGWLAAEPIIREGARGAAGATAYVCTPAARRVASVQPAVASLALESLPRVWRDLIVPRLQRECATSRQPYTTIGSVFDACGGVSLVNECLDLAGRALDAAGPDGAITPDLRHAGEAVRWMWRATSDLPVPYSPLLTRLGRVADPLLDRLARGEPALAAADTPWAGIVAEHALIVAERVFMEADMGDADEGRRALTRLVGTLPDLDGGVLPPLDAILTHTGADRQCWLTAYLSALEYGILMTRDDIETLLAATPLSVERVRSAVGRLAALRGRLNALERAESADETARGLDRAARWNYPSLARWDRGRIPATFPYWSSLALLAEARDGCDRAWRRRWSFRSGARGVGGGYAPVQ